MPRIDVTTALAILSDSDLHERWQNSENSWPETLDEAIHWLIDDTFLDLRPAATAESRPDLFVTDEEARLVQTAVDRLGSLIDELGDTPAADYVRHDRWSQVVDACRRAHNVMTVESPQPDQ